MGGTMTRYYRARIDKEDPLAYDLGGGVRFKGASHDEVPPLRPPVDPYDVDGEVRRRGEAAKHVLTRTGVELDSFPSDELRELLLYGRDKPRHARLERAIRALLALRALEESQ